MSVPAEPIRVIVVIVVIRVRSGRSQWDKTLSNHLDLALSP